MKNETETENEQFEIHNQVQQNFSPENQNNQFHQHQEHRESQNQNIQNLENPQNNPNINSQHLTQPQVPLSQQGNFVRQNHQNQFNNIQISSNYVYDYTLFQNKQNSRVQHQTLPNEDQIIENQQSGSEEKEKKLRKQMKKEKENTHHNQQNGMAFIFVADPIIYNSVLNLNSPMNQAENQQIQNKNEGQAIVYVDPQLGQTCCFGLYLIDKNLCSWILETIIHCCILPCKFMDLLITFIWKECLAHVFQLCPKTSLNLEECCLNLSMIGGKITIKQNIKGRCFHFFQKQLTESFQNFCSCCQEYCNGKIIINCVQSLISQLKYLCSIFSGCIKEVCICIYQNIMPLAVQLFNLLELIFLFIFNLISTILEIVLMPIFELIRMVFSICI